MARRRVLMVVAAAALIGPVAYLDIAYGLHGGDKPLTDYMFQASSRRETRGCATVRPSQSFSLQKEKKGERCCSSLWLDSLMC